MAYHFPHLCSVLDQHNTCPLQQTYFYSPEWPCATICYGLCYHADGQHLTPHASPPLFIQRFLQNTSICFFSHLEIFTMRKFIGGSQKSPVILGSCQHWHRAKSIGIAGEAAGAKESLRHREHPGIHFWHLGEPHASQLDSHFHAPTINTTGSGFFFPRHLSLAPSIKSDFRA